MNIEDCREIDICYCPVSMLQIARINPTVNSEMDISEFYVSIETIEIRLKSREKIFDVLHVVDTFRN